MKRVLQLIVETLREIFDESAYVRFLERQGQAGSRASYAAFLAEQRRLRERRVKCC